MRFIHLARGYWSGQTRLTAWLLTLGFLACLLVNMVVALAVNRWSKQFFDALQSLDKAAIVVSIQQLALLAVAVSVAAIATIKFRMHLQLGWRVWLMADLVDRWLPHGDMRDSAPAAKIDNPEARIAEDGRLAVDLFVDLAGGIVNIFLVASSFIVVLWQVGGSSYVMGVYVPGFLVLAVVAYASFTSLTMWLLARPLVANVEQKAAAEGDLRYALTLARDRTMAANLMHLDFAARFNFQSAFANVKRKWGGVIHGMTKIAALTSANNLLAPIVPLMLCAPKFLAGDMTLGDLMQAAAAFLQVQLALNWLADNALSIANWSASARRVAELEGAFGGQRRSPAVEPAIVAPPIRPSAIVTLRRDRVPANVLTSRTEVMAAACDAATPLNRG